MMAKFKDLGPMTPGRVLKSRRLRDFFWMAIGATITGWSLDAFLIPNKIAAGGVSGLATIGYYVLRDHGIYVSVGVQMLIMNAILLGLAIRVRGWHFGARTVYGAVLLSVAVDGLAPFTPALATNDHLLAVLYGGAVAGLGMGLVFKAGGNTGGTDILAQLLVRKVSLGVGQLLMLADGFVLLTAALVFGPQYALYGFIAVFTMSWVIDIVQEGLSVDKAVFIISNESARIADAILNDMGRGATGLNGTGLYSGEPRQVIFTVISRREIDDLKAIVRAIDARAFVIVSEVREVLGEGFKEFNR